MDTAAIQIEVPNDLLSEISLDELKRLAHEAFYVRLYQQGKISSGHAGVMLGMSRSDFLDLLGRYGVRTSTSRPILPRICAMRNMLAHSW